MYKLTELFKSSNVSTHNQTDFKKENKYFKGSSQHKVGGEWFEIKLGKISRMLVKYEVLPIPNVIFVC